MRIKMIFQLKQPELDIEYRRRFSTLLEDCLRDSAPGAIRSFTFATFLPKPTFMGNIVRLSSTEITLSFSTYYPESGINFYNSLIRKREYFETCPIPGDNALRLKRVSLQKEKRITSGEMVFKTISPFLVRRRREESDNDEYLTAKHSLFIPQIEADISKTIKELTGKQDRVKFIPVKLNEGIPIKHGGMFVEGNSGIFKLTGEPGILDFIYKVGIGSRRPEGFGFLEVVG